jgi:hypothetical protein
VKHKNQNLRYSLELQKNATDNKNRKRDTTSVTGFTLGLNLLFQRRKDCQIFSQRTPIHEHVHKQKKESTVLQLMPEKRPDQKTLERHKMQF